MTKPKKKVHKPSKVEASLVAIHERIGRIGIVVDSARAASELRITNRIEAAEERLAKEFADRLRDDVEHVTRQFHSAIHEAQANAFNDAIVAVRKEMRSIAGVALEFAARFVMDARRALAPTIDEMGTNGIEAAAAKYREIVSKGNGTHAPSNS